MGYLIYLILGDCLWVVLMGLYAGVGIMESDGAFFMSCMLIPAVLVWLGLALLLRLYPSPAAFTFPTDCVSLNDRIVFLIRLQNVRKFIPVWFLGTLFSVCWESFCWHQIVGVKTWFHLSPGLLIWFFASCIAFFCLHRCIFMAVVLIHRLSAENAMVKHLCIVLISLCAIYLCCTLAINLHYRGKEYSLDNVPEDAPRTALVLGAGVYRNGEPSKILRNRVETAVRLYRMGRIDFMIMSGDNSDASLNEVDKMEQLALEAGVPQEAILRDEAGWHTYESCVNLKKNFGLDKATVVTQNFHATRALFTCDRVGVKGISVSADLDPYNRFSEMLWYLKEWLTLPLRFVY